MKPRIVIAEDETLTRMDICEMLKEAGYDVVGEGSDGIEALKECRQKTPDIVLLDIKMPLMSGLDVAKILKEENQEVCVIILSAYNIREFIDKATENSVMGYLIKPIDEEIFLSKLKMIYCNYLKMKEFQEEAKKAKKKLEERKLIEKSKGILMENNNISENEAYTKIRNIAMQKRISMEEVAKIIIVSGGIEI